MELLLFTGFLGSGKTTLILAVAKRLAALGRPSCIIVNEVGDIGIDGTVLEEGGLEVFEITSGCICCQIGVDLVKTLQEVTTRYAPEVVIVEASGVATPSGVIDALRYFTGTPLAVRSIGLLDPTRLEALLAVMEPLAESQITGADELVITKTDEATPEELAFARTAVARIAPDTPLSAVSALDPATLTAWVERLTDSGGSAR